MQGYKVFNPDFTCRAFQFEVGKTYEHEGEVILCKSGFHFCENAIDCFNYYSFHPDNIVCEVECEDCTDTEDDSKRACKKITIVKQLSWHEVLDLCNTGKGNTGKSNSGDRNSGDRNSGDCNSGDRNSGDCNSGYRNSGDYNSGDRNSGDCNSGYRNSGDYNSGDCNSGNCNSGYYNSGDYNSGFFNTDEPTVRMFNKETELKRSEVGIPYIHLELEKDGEKVQYKEAWKTAWNELDEEVKQRFLNLPNFDSKIFFEITGVDVDKL